MAQHHHTDVQQWASSDPSHSDSHAMAALEIEARLRPVGTIVDFDREGRGGWKVCHARRRPELS
jgi:hypothetical protein